MQKSRLLYALLVTTVCSMTATTTTHLVAEDFAIKRGQTKAVEVYLNNPDYAFTGMQCDITLSGGLKLVEGTHGPIISPTERIPQDDNTFVSAGRWQTNETYRYLFYNSDGLYVSGTDGAIFTILVTTDDTFGSTGAPASIAFSTVKLSDMYHPETAHKVDNNTAYAFMPMSCEDIFANSNIGKKCFIDDAMNIVAIANDTSGATYAFAYDDHEHWLKLAFPNGNTTLTEGACYASGTIGGIVTDATINPTIVIETPGDYTPVNSDIFPSKQVIDLQDQQDNVELRPNEVIDITGFYHVNSEGKTCISEWSGLNGNRGTEVEINTNMCPEVDFAGNQAKNGGKPVQYHFSQAVVQRKATAVNSPAQKASAEATPYDNYIIYPIVGENYIGTIVTGIDGIANNATVQSVRYINAAGIESCTPHDGINIVITTYTDGTSKTSKIIK